MQLREHRVKRLKYLKYLDLKYLPSHVCSQLYTFIACKCEITVNDDSFIVHFTYFHMKLFAWQEKLDALATLCMLTLIATDGVVPP